MPRPPRTIALGVRVWWLWMVAGTLTCLVYPFVPAGTVASAALYNGLGLVSFAVILLAVRHNRPANPRAWYVVATGVITYVSADIVYEVSGLILGHHPYPYWDDALYFAAYPFLWVGLLMAARGRGRGDLPGVIDAAVIAIAVGLVYWVFVMDPIIGDHEAPMFERLVTVGYPTFDVLMCAVLTRLVTRGNVRSPGMLLLIAGTVLNLACDITWTVSETIGTYNGGWINAAFMFVYVCWAGSPLHPSMRPAALARTPEPTGFGRGRLALLGGSTLLVPGVLILQGIQQEKINWGAIGIGAIALFLLVLARMSGFVGQVQEQSSRLEHLAMRDSLTGLANRRRFEQGLTTAVASGSPQVCLLDLNGFKVINDRLGHTLGDRLLVAVAERLTAAMRDVDVVARMGGDEFAILVPDATTAEGDAIVHRLTAALREPVVVGGHELLVAASIGIADAGGTTDPGEVLRRADVAMYAAKEAGGRFRRHSPELDHQAGEEARLGAEMRVGLDAGQFRMVYQPIVGLPTGRIRYVESLVRWQHPDRGFVSPADFIPVAEQNGMIVDLGEWILRTACAQFTRWQREHGTHAPERISVNVSARQLAEPGFAEVVAAVLAETGMRAGDLIVEVTETAVFGGGVAVQAVNDLHELGVRIALDDFGTGHSSLGLLQTVPVDILKVDKSFVDNLTMAGRHAVIATALIQVSNGLGLTAVAEGVETAEQAAELHRLGYQLAQGYHFGRPLAEPDFRGAALTIR